MINVTTTNNVKKSEELMFRTKILNLDLMKKAGVACSNSFKFFGKVAILSGTGNNAGDGFVLAYELYKKNIDVTIILLKEKFSENGKHYFDICKENNIKILKYDFDMDLSKYNILVDSILGIGIKKNLDYIYINAIKNINETKNKNKDIIVLSIDINSGLNSDTGIGDVVVKSDMTLSIGVFKLGHFLNMAKDYIKNKINLDIGIELIDESYKVAEFEDIIKMFDKRKNFSHKGSFGKVCLFGGSLEYSGAIQLSNMALSSLKSGAGISAIAVPRFLADIVIKNILESTLFLIDSNDDEIIFNRENIDVLIDNYDVITFGMGVGRSIGAEEILYYLLENYSKKLVIDADGLFILSQNINLLKKSKAKIVLTPHLKEFERLYNSYRKSIGDFKEYTVLDILNNQIEFVLDFCKYYDVVLLLKGATSLIVENEQITLVDRGTNGMATAGSGDVLSGIVTGLLGYFHNVYNAVVASTFINGMAGEFASSEMSNFSQIASDTVKFIPKVFKKIEDVLNDETN